MRQHDKKKTLTYVIAILICWLSLTTFSLAITKSVARLGFLDFPIFISHAHLFLDEGIVYLRDLSLYGPGQPIYKFPPLYVSFLSEAVRNNIPENMIYFNAWLLQTLCFVGGIFLCLNTKTRNDNAEENPITISCIFAFALCNRFYLENSYRLQLEPYIFLLMSFSVFLLSRNKKIIPGFFIGTATMLKIYPAFMLIISLINKKNRTLLIGFFTSCILAATLSVWLLNLNEHIFYAMHVFPELLNEGISDSRENISIGAMFGVFTSTSEIPEIMLKLAFGISIFFSCLPMLLKKNYATETNKTIAIDFAALFMAMLVWMPNFWWNYQILNLLPGIIAIKLIAEKPMLYKISLATLSIAFFLQTSTTMAPTSLFELALSPKDYVLLRGLIQIFLLISILTLQWKIHSIRKIKA